MGDCRRIDKMEDKVVLITGASSGIGYKKLSIVARREEKLKELAQKCKAKGAKDVLVLPLDLSEMECAKSAVVKTVEHFKRLDIMICNAGVADMKTMVNLRDMNMDDYMHTFNLNFFCPVIMTKEALPHLEKTKGNIIQVSSIVASSPGGGEGHLSAYGTSKAALSYFTKAINRQECANGIRINILSPGVVMTPIMTQFVNVQKTGKAEIDESLMDEARNSEELQKTSRMGRLGEPIEMAKLMAFMVSDDNAYMSGSEIISDGGI